MKGKAFCRLSLVLALLVLMTGSVPAMDEAILTATHDKVVAQEEKEFNDAMGVWFKHRYADGEKMLREFSKKYPESRWAAEADLHVGCYLTFRKQYAEAKPIFEKLMEKYPDSNIKTKAKLRLANVAERTGKWDEAIAHYTEALKMDPTWDQFKYANYRARRLLMSKGKLNALTNCGPVALAACLDQLGRKNEAAEARNIKAGEDGMSMAALISEASKFGVTAQAVEMSVDQIKPESLPLLAHVHPNHFVAVLSVKDGQVELEDSIQGKYNLSIEALKNRWMGKVLTFSSVEGLKQISALELNQIIGGCCGQADEDECLGTCPDDCQQAFAASAKSRSNSSGGGGGCTNCGPGSGSVSSPFSTAPSI